MSASEHKTLRRTLVELYDPDYLENIISLLYGGCSAVVYVYFARANEPAKEDRAALSHYIRSQFGFEPTFLSIEENTVDCALAAFRKLTGDGQQYDFDITGGSSVFIAAAGALAVGDGGRRITLHEYAPDTGHLVFSYPKHPASARRDVPAQLTADQLFALQRIQVLHPERPVRYELDYEDLRGEVLRLWEAIRDELRTWSTFSVLPSQVSAGDGCFYVDKQMNDRQKASCARLLDRLSRSGIISQLHKRTKDNRTEVSYRLHVPPSALFLYDKGGSILEMLTYVAAADSGCFSDCCTGISLDWSNVSSGTFANPYNEIDTVLVRNHVPYFISCKNTDIQNDYLYEIMVMARHFGGKYAIPAMICSTRCNTHLHTRAKEMGVRLIDDIASMTASEFAGKLVSVLCPTEP